MRREFESILDLAKTLPAEELPCFLGQLEEIRLTAHARLTTPATAAKSGEEWLTVDQVADRLGGKSHDYVYRHAKDWPFTRKLGNGYLFSASGLDAFLKRSK